METEFKAPTQEEMTQELIKQHVEEGHHKEALEIIPQRMKYHKCSLKEAVEFVAYWVHRVK